MLIANVKAFLTSVWSYQDAHISTEISFTLRVRSRLCAYPNKLRARESVCSRMQVGTRACIYASCKPIKFGEICCCHLLAFYRFFFSDIFGSPLQSTLVLWSLTHHLSKQLTNIPNILNFVSIYIANNVWKWDKDHHVANFECTTSRH